MGVPVARKARKARKEQTSRVNRESKIHAPLGLRKRMTSTRRLLILSLLAPTLISVASASKKDDEAAASVQPQPPTLIRGEEPGLPKGQDGVVALSLRVGTDGKPRDLRVRHRGPLIRSMTRQHWNLFACGDSHQLPVKVSRLRWRL